MDRRTYLAFALVILVLIVHSVFFGPKQRPRPVSEPARDLTEVVPSRPGIEAPKTTALPPREPHERMLQDKDASEASDNLVFIETDLVEAEFDPVGGTIRSWRLRDYTDAAEEQADLVRTREIGAVWFALRNGQRIIRTDSTRFHASVYRDNEETLIKFLAQDSLGLYVEKSYRIPIDRYDCELSIRVEGMGESHEGSSWVDRWTSVVRARPKARSHFDQLGRTVRKGVHAHRRRRRDIRLRRRRWRQEERRTRW